MLYIYFPEAPYTLIIIAFFQKPFKYCGDQISH